MEWACLAYIGKQVNIVYISKTTMTLLQDVFKRLCSIPCSGKDEGEMLLHNSPVFAVQMLHPALASVLLVFTTDC